MKIPDVQCLCWHSRLQKQPCSPKCPSLQYIVLPVQLLNCNLTLDLKPGLEKCIKWSERVSKFCFWWGVGNSAEKVKTLSTQTCLQQLLSILRKKEEKSKKCIDQAFLILQNKPVSSSSLWRAKRLQQNTTDQTRKHRWTQRPDVLTTISRKKQTQTLHEIKRLPCSPYSWFYTAYYFLTTLSRFVEKVHVDFLHFSPLCRSVL